MCRPIALSLAVLVSCLLVLVHCSPEAGDVRVLEAAVSGLEGTGLILEVNGARFVSVDANGAFVLADLPVGSNYTVTVRAQPQEPPEICLLSNDSGTIGSAPTTTVDVSCAATHLVGGIVTEISGTGLVLHLEPGEDLAVSGRGPFGFQRPLRSGTEYVVTVARQPTGPSQTCSVGNAQGVVGDVDVSSIEVVCATDAFAVGGRVSGLAAGTSVALRNNGSDEVVVTANQDFAFPQRVASGADYRVTIGGQPTNPWQTCEVDRRTATGTIGDTDVTSVRVRCQLNTYSVTGTIAGLEGTGLTLNVNGEVVAVEPGTTSVGRRLTSGSSYSFSILNQPTDPWQTCEVDPRTATGTIGGADVTSVRVQCVLNTYSVTATIAGLDGTGLALNVNGEVVAVEPGTTSISRRLTSGSSYSFSILSQPTGLPLQQCQVAQGSGTVAGHDVTDIAVTCITTDRVLRAFVTGLTGTLRLLVTPGGEVDVTSDGTFELARLTIGTQYTVSVTSQPDGQDCSVTDGTGTMGDSDTVVYVTCGPAIDPFS